MIALIVPVLGRPDRAEVVSQSIRDATTVDHRVVFVCSPDDRAEIDACEATGHTVLVTPWRRGRGDWARKINLGYQHTDDPYLLLGADDLRFWPDWDTWAIRTAERTGAGVIGTNDLGNPRVKSGRLSTHPVVTRAYADEHGTIDGPGQVVTERYRHNFVDVELTETAMARNAWAFERRSIVEHLHPHWGKGDDDATYRLGEEGFQADAALFRQRSVGWKPAARRRR